MVQERSRKIIPSLKRAEEVLEGEAATNDSNAHSGGAEDVVFTEEEAQGATFDTSSEAHSLVVASLKRLLKAHPEWQTEANAFIQQAVLVQHMPLSKRRLPSPSDTSSNTFLTAVSSIMTELLSSPHWQ